MEAKTIWKYALDPMRTESIEMPIGSKILHVAGQHGLVCFWAEIPERPEDGPSESRTFFVTGTGHPLPNGESVVQHVGTAFTQIGALVWHVYEVLP